MRAVEIIIQGRAGDTWFAVDASSVTVAEQSGLDGARRPAAVVLVDHVVPDARVLPGLSLATVRAIAETGVDAISVGALTHSAGSLDVGLELNF